MNKPSDRALTTTQEEEWRAGVEAAANAIEETWTQGMSMWEAIYALNELSIRGPLPEPLIPREGETMADALYRDAKELERQGNELLERARHQFTDAYEAGWKADADADIGVDSLLTTEEGDGTHPNQMGPWSW